MWCRRGPGISRAEHAAAPGNNLNAVRFLFAFNIDTSRNYFQRSPFGVKDWLLLQSILTIHLPLCIHPIVLHIIPTNSLSLSTLVFQSASPILTCFLCMAQYVLSTGSLSVQSCCKSPRSRMWCHSRSTSTGEDPFVKVFFAGSSVQNMEDLYYYPSIQHISVLKFKVYTLTQL